MKHVAFIALVTGLFIFGSINESFAHEYRSKTKTVAVKSRVRVSMYLPWLNISWRPSCYKRMVRAPWHRQRKNHFCKTGNRTHREETRDCR
jgi:hypothetical protein